MAKKEKNATAQAIDIAGQQEADESRLPTPEAETPPTEILPEPIEILSEEQARKLVAANYSVPEGCKIVFVTEDRNVFWSENESSAINYSKRRNLKLFRLTWD